MKHSLRIMLVSIVLSSLVSALVSGCAAGNSPMNATSGAGGGAGTGGNGSGGEGGFNFPDSGTTNEGEIYVNSLDKLYKFEPIGKTIQEIGTFDCVVADPSGTADGGMHDLAVDKNDNLYGVAKLGPQIPNSVSSEHVILSIDKATGHCEKIFALPNDLVNPQTGLEIRGLSFVPSGTLQTNTETLVAMEIQGSYISIDLVAKTAKLVGDLNGGVPGQWSTKGADIVSLILDKTYVTAKLEKPTDNLAVMDPKTGAIITNLGETPITTIGGLAYWGGTLYGFSGEGGVYAIDPTNGATTGIAVAGVIPGMQFHGAGVTTAAPIEPPK